jgi:predicted nucleotidyltransferase
MRNRDSALRGIVRNLVRHYKPEKLILFGSRARGRCRADSDIDLAVVKKTRRKFIDRILDARRAADTWEAVDIVVYTPEEVARMEREGQYFWMDEILGRGRVLYERA